MIPLADQYRAAIKSKTLSKQPAIRYTQPSRNKVEPGNNRLPGALLWRNVHVDRRETTVFLKVVKHAGQLGLRLIYWLDDQAALATAIDRAALDQKSRFPY